MRFLSFVLISLIVVTAFISCDPCAGKYYECPSFSGGASLRIVWASDGKDLVFGPNRVYDRSQFKFYTLKGTDTAFLNYQIFNLPTDSLIGVAFSPQTETVYMRLGNGDVDTLSFAYQTMSSKCCGTNIVFSKITVNNVSQPATQNPILEVRK